jgi:multidrug transporter EmrE-like cation transporter
MDFTAYALLLLVIIIGVAGQLLLKQGMSRHRGGFQLSALPTLARNWAVMVGFACYGLSTLLYFQVLSRLDLSLAYPTVSLGYVLVIILSRLFFNEKIRPARWGAVAIICVGVALVGLGAG